MVEDLWLQALEVARYLDDLENFYQDHNPDWLIKQLEQIDAKVLVLTNDISNRIEFIRSDIKPMWSQGQTLE